MSLFTDIRDVGRIEEVEELFDSPSAASEATEQSAAEQGARITAAGQQIAASRARATSIGAGTAAERRGAAASFAQTAFESKIKTGPVIESVSDPSSKVSVREATRLDFAAVTAPHLLLERKGTTARGEGVVSKKR